jgi:Mitochondrial-associated sphingomyelin phosphodiesterase
MLADMFSIDKSGLFSMEESVGATGVIKAGASAAEQLLGISLRRVPDTVPGSMRLTETGRMQIIKGNRKCSKMDIKHECDDLYLPVATYENEFLVHLMVYLTEIINERYQV